MSEVIESVVRYYDVTQSKYNYNHKVTLQDGNKYSNFLDADQPLANPGDKVKVEVYQNNKGYNQFNPDKFKVLERAKGHQQASSGGGNDPRQSSILRQNAMSQANSLVAALIENGRYDSLNDEELAEHVLYLAENYFFPYGSEGKMPDQKNPVTDFSHEMGQQAQDHNNFDDDAPF